MLVVCRRRRLLALPPISIPASRFCFRSGLVVHDLSPATDCLDSSPHLIVPSVVAYLLLFLDYISRVRCVFLPSSSMLSIYCRCSSLGIYPAPECVRTSSMRARPGIAYNHGGVFPMSRSFYHFCCFSETLLSSPIGKRSNMRTITSGSVNAHLSRLAVLQVRPGSDKLDDNVNGMRAWRG